MVGHLHPARAYGSALLVGALLAGLLAGGARPAAAATFDNAERIAATSFIAAGVAVSEEVFGGGADAVVLATAANFPDALAASALAADVGGPVLFTDPDALPVDTRAEIERVLDAGQTVFLMGGPAAITEEVADTLRGDGYAVTRMEGPTRLETAAVTAERVGTGPGGTVLIARAFGPDGANTASDRTTGWVDAISCGGHAARTVTPILLTETETLSDTTAQALADLDATDAIICGGENAVSATVLVQLRAQGVEPHRVEGPTRVETAIAVADELFGYDTAAGNDYVVVNGFDQNFGYGLAATPLAAQRDAALLLVDDNQPTGCDEAAQSARETICYLETVGAGRADLVVLGGRDQVSTAVFDALARAAGGTEVVAGALDPPDGVAAVDAGNDDGTAVRVSWRAVDDPDDRLAGYNVYVGTGSASQRFGSADPSVAANSTEVVVTGLEADTEYRFAVTSVTDDDVESDKSAEVRATPRDEAPSVVTNFVARGQDESVDLTWTASPETDVTGYEISRATGGTCPDDDADFTVIAEIDGRQATSHSDDDVTNDTAYCYRLVAIDEAEQRSTPAEAIGTPNDGSPSATFQSPEPGATILDQETLHFSAPYTITYTVADSDTPLNALDVRIQFAPDDITPFVTIFDGKHPTTTPQANFVWQWRDTANPPQPVGDVDTDTARFRIVVSDSPTRNNAVTSSQFSTERAPSQVVGVTAVPQINGPVVVRWTASPELEVDTYTVLRKEVPITAQTDSEEMCRNPVIMEEAVATVPGRTTTTYSDADVQAGSANDDFLYCYRIQANRVGPDFSGPPSAVASANAGAMSATVSLSSPSDDQRIARGRNFPMAFTGSTPPDGGATVRIMLSYCVNYEEPIGGIVGSASCADPDGFKKIETVTATVNAADRTFTGSYTWAVPNSIMQSQMERGAVRAQVVDAADMPAGGSDTNSGIEFV